MPRILNLTVRLLIAWSLILAPVSGALAMASMTGAAPGTLEHCGVAQTGPEPVTTHQAAHGATDKYADHIHHAMGDCELCAYCGHCLTASVSSADIGHDPAHFPTPGFLPAHPHEPLPLASLRPPDFA